MLFEHNVICLLKLAQVQHNTTQTQPGRHIHQFTNKHLRNRSSKIDFSTQFFVHSLVHIFLSLSFFRSFLALSRHSRRLRRLLLLLYMVIIYAGMVS